MQPNSEQPRTSQPEASQDSEQLAAVVSLAGVKRSLGLPPGQHQLPTNFNGEYPVAAPAPEVPAKLSLAPPPKRSSQNDSTVTSNKPKTNAELLAKLRQAEITNRRGLAKVVTKAIDKVSGRTSYPQAPDK